MARYRWAAKPAWILSHLFVLGCVLGFVRAGIWQLDRLDQVRTENAVEAAREQEPVVPLPELIHRQQSPEDIDARVLRSVTATGSYLADEQVLIRNQPLNGSPGYHVVTPLQLADGTAVVVNRGWVPLVTGDRDPAAFAPPPGRVTVTGRIAAGRVQSGMGVTDPAEGELDKLARVDLPRLQRQTGVSLLPVYVELTAQDPPAGDLPAALPAPTQDEGNHLNYAGQWFIFALLTCVVYPLLLRRTARSKAVEVAGEPLVGAAA